MEVPMASNRRQLLGTCCAAFSTLLAPKLLSPSHAESGKYPTKPVRVIVPFAPGGPNDLLARILAQGLSTSLGAQFYVENLGGAGGNIGTGHASHAPPDGYTILMVAPS